MNCDVTRRPAVHVRPVPPALYTGDRPPAHPPPHPPVNERFENINLLRAFAAIGRGRLPRNRVYELGGVSDRWTTVDLPDRMDRRRPVLRDQRLRDHAQCVGAVSSGRGRFLAPLLGAPAVEDRAALLPDGRLVDPAIQASVLRPAGGSLALATRFAPDVHAHLLAQDPQLDRWGELDARDRNAVLPRRRVACPMARQDARLAHMARVHPDRVGVARGRSSTFSGATSQCSCSWRQMQLPGALDEFGAGIFLAKLLDGKPDEKRTGGWGWLARGALPWEPCASGSTGGMRATGMSPR